MFDFLASMKLGSDAIPRGLTTLSVSWLNDEFRAVAVHRGKVETTWERPGKVEADVTFDALLREAVEKTGYRGETVSLLLAHPRLAQQLVDVPPVKGATLVKVIERQAQQQRMFNEEAAWASQTSPSGKDALRVVLHLFPKLLLDGLVRDCKRNGLELTSVVPASALLQQQITQLPLAKDQVALLVAETGGSTTLVLGRRDAQILLARTLPGTWNRDPERLAVDLNRTILFVSQQYGLALTQGIWLFGPGAEQQTDLLHTRTQLPVSLSPVPCGPFYWASEAAKLRPELNPNFITREMRKAPQRRTFAKVVVGGAALAMLVSLGASGYFLFQERREAANVKTLNRQAARLRMELQSLQQADDKMERKARLAKLVLADRPPPVAAWLLAYLGEAVPPSLVVTNFQVKRQEDHYQVRLAGTFQRAGNQSTPVAPASAITELMDRLGGEPFHLRILKASDPGSAKGPASAAEAAGADWLSRVSKGTTLKPVVQDQFVIEGVMR